MARDYCFTAWREPKPDEDKCRYWIYGRENCPKTGREHYQGFIVFNRTHKMPGAKRIINGGDDCHLEQRGGTRQEARDYCTKDGDWREHGQLEAKTPKEILQMPINWIKENEPLMFCRYHRGIEKLHAVQGEKWREVKVYILWGKTGTGKTREVMEKDDVYKIDPPYTWWDGYCGESILLLDDFRIGAINRGMLLNLLDGYRLRLETKGGHTWALWKEVYITTNFNPECWDDAIMRRVTSVRAMGNTVP